MNKNNVNHKEDLASPAANNYNEKIKNKNNQNTPYGANEPSSKTTYK
ncbi:hypothetical protein [Clostridium sp. B9]